MLHRVAGVDEAGRGCLAGPVVAAAVILPMNFSHPFLRDSKTLSPSQRLCVFEALLQSDAAIGIGMQGPEAIDKLNILQATLLAMQEAVESLPTQPGKIRIDGPAIPPALRSAAEPCIHGDRLFAEIAAASIVAKVIRDRVMVHLHELYPVYGWAKNKGYPTPAHRQAIQEFGLSPLHRRSFILEKRADSDLR
ncbi:MAG: ribonuclease HII [Bacteroidia bacterium]|nr:ribonuclease HII [Bacteroidia bacterium]MDW8416076.1 ribonuclease HII [Bacteroidia bacterium]